MIVVICGFVNFIIIGIIAVDIVFVIIFVNGFVILFVFEMIEEIFDKKFVEDDLYIVCVFVMLKFF